MLLLGEVLLPLCLRVIICSETVDCKSFSSRTYMVQKEEIFYNSMEQVEQLEHLLKIGVPVTYSGIISL